MTCRRPLLIHRPRPWANRPFCLKGALFSTAMYHRLTPLMRERSPPPVMGTGRAAPLRFPRSATDSVMESAKEPAKDSDRVGPVRLLRAVMGTSRAAPARSLQAVTGTRCPIVRLTVRVPAACPIGRRIRLLAGRLVGPPCGFPTRLRECAQSIAILESSAKFVRLMTSSTASTTRSGVFCGRRPAGPALLPLLLSRKRLQPLLKRPHHPYRPSPHMSRCPSRLLNRSSPNL